MTLVDFIRSRRESLGLSLRLAAQKLRVDPAYLSRVEAGKVPPSTQLLLRLSLLPGCQLDELMLLARRLPESIQALVEKEPHRAAAAIRTMAEMSTDPGAPYGEALGAESPGDHLAAGRRQRCPDGVGLRRVHVYGWEDIVDRLSDFSDLYRAYLRELRLEGGLFGGANPAAAG